MYTELFIRPVALADEIIYPESARKLVAKACDGMCLPPLMFNRGPDGKTIQGRYFHPDKNHIEAYLPHLPVVSYDGGKGFLKIIMFGQPGRDLMSDTAAVIGTCIGKHLGGPYTFSLNEGDCKIRSLHTPALYSIRRLVCAKRPALSQQFMNTPPHDVSDDLRRILLRGLLSQARWLDENGASGLELAIPHEDVLGFSVAEGTPTVVEVKEGLWTAAYARLAFSMNLELVGPWFAGHLRARGFGQIKKMVLQQRSDSK